MKKQLRPAALILAVILLLATSACAKDPGIVYQDDSVSVKEVTPSAEVTYSSMEWQVLTPEDFLGVPIMIVTGKITNLRDVEVSYTSHGEPKTERMALFDFEVSNYLLNTTSVESKNVLTVGYPFESDFLVQDVPVLENGKEFLLFLQYPDDLIKNGQEDPMKRASFMDVHVLGPYQLMCEKVDGAYIIPDSLRSYFTAVDRVTKSDAIKEIIAARGTTDGSVFAVECSIVEQVIAAAAEAYPQG